MSQSNALLIDKLLNAPVEVVWSAWEDPTKLAQWWRTSSIEKTVITEYDFRPGGAWKQYAIFEGGIAIGKNNPGSVFKEIIPHQKIVSSPLPAKEDSIEVVPNALETVVSFKSVGDDQTRVTISLIRGVQDDWQPGEAQQRAYEEMFSNLAAFIESIQAQ